MRKYRLGPYVVSLPESYRNEFVLVNRTVGESVRNRKGTTWSFDEFLEVIHQNILNSKFPNPPSTSTQLLSLLSEELDEWREELRTYRPNLNELVDLASVAYHHLESTGGCYYDSRDESVFISWHDATGYLLLLLHKFKNAIVDDSVTASEEEHDERKRRLLSELVHVSFRIISGEGIRWSSGK